MDLGPHRCSHRPTCPPASPLINPIATGPATAATDNLRFSSASVNPIPTATVQPKPHTAFALVCPHVLLGPWLAPVRERDKKQNPSVREPWNKHNLSMRHSNNHDLFERDWSKYNRL